MRPRVQVWAGRADIDRDRLAQILKEDFICQFEAARERSKTANQDAFANKIESLKLEQEQSGRDAGNTLQFATQLALSGLLMMFFVANPAFYIILFTLAIFSGVNSIAMSLNYLRCLYQASGDADKLKREQQKLEAEFDSKNKAFAQAVNNMTIHVHPVLQQAISLLCELDDTPFVPINVEATVTGFPPVYELLQTSNYRMEVPMEYLPLIELIQQE